MTTTGAGHWSRFTAAPCRSPATAAHHRSHFTAAAAGRTPAGSARRAGHLHVLHGGRHGAGGSAPLPSLRPGAPAAGSLARAVLAAQTVRAGRRRTHTRAAAGWRRGAAPEVTTRPPPTDCGPTAAAAAATAPRPASQPAAGIYKLDTCFQAPVPNGAISRAGLRATRPEEPSKRWVAGRGSCYSCLSTVITNWEKW